MLILLIMKMSARKKNAFFGQNILEGPIKDTFQTLFKKERGL